MNKARKRNKGKSNEKINKTILFADAMVIYVENSKAFTKRQLKLINQFSKVRM